MRTLKLLSYSAALATAALLTTGLATPAAAATDGKGYPGAMCRPVSVPSANQTFTISVGRLFNHSASNLTLSCPAAKDITRLGGAVVRVVDQNQTADVSCTMFSMRIDGSVQQQQQLSTSGFSTSVKELVFTGQSSPSGGGGYYTLECQLPPRGIDSSSIVMYQINEVD